MRWTLLLSLLVACDSPDGGAAGDAALEVTVADSAVGDTGVAVPDGAVDSSGETGVAVDGTVVEATSGDALVPVDTPDADTDDVDDGVDEVAVETVDDVALETLDDVASEVVEDVVQPITYPRACSSVYDANEVPTFRIQMADDEWQGMRDDCGAGTQRYRPISFGYEDQWVVAKMRLKGNWSWNCDKMQFVVSFNEDDKDERFHGLRKMVFDAPWYDPTVMRERVAMDFLHRYGAPYSCANHARVEVNGALYGLYTNLERLDREYLERHFDDPSGNLYEGGREKKTNEDDPDTSDIDAFWAAGSVDELGAIVDLEHAVRVWAGEAMLPDMDGYWAGVDINWYIYHHPTQGLLYLTYDADLSFSENIWPDAVRADPLTWEHPGWGREAQMRMVLSDPTWCEAFVDALRDARAAYDVPLMQGQVDAWAAAMASDIAADPHKTFSLDEHDDAVAALKVFFEERAAFVDGWLAGDHCPVVWP